MIFRWPMRLPAHSRRAKKPLVISGTSCASEAVIQAAANVAMAAHAALSFTAPECNSVGRGTHGWKPTERGISSGQGWPRRHRDHPRKRSLSPRARCRSRLRSSRLRAHVIVLDHLANPTTEKAELVLPAGTFAESDGTFVSSEGRAQRFFQVFVPENEVLASWRWLKPDHWHNSGRRASRRWPSAAGTCGGTRCRAVGRSFALPERRFRARRIAKADERPCS